MTVQALFEQSKTLAAFSGIAAFHEPMSAHTTFKIGGPADLYLRPDSGCFVSCLTALLRLARPEGIPIFVLGGGANLLVADTGIRGVVFDTGSWAGIGSLPEKAPADSLLHAATVFRAGTPTDDAVRWAAANGLGGLEDFAGLPGTIGGAVWMNARCYESSFQDILAATVILDERLQQVTVATDLAEFSYKKSPFQQRDAVILAACLSLRPGDPAQIKAKTAARRAEREAKGHFRYPSAGSVFKNNREHGKPAGKIIDELGLRGVKAGGAQIAPWHGNFIINIDGATAHDVRQLIALAEKKARDTLGLTLEREIIYAG